MLNLVKLYPLHSKCGFGAIERGGHHSQNENRPKLQNTSPNFGYMVQKCWTKVAAVEKRNFYDVFFCKFKLSEMASIKTNKNKNRIPLLKTNFS